MSQSATSLPAPKIVIIRPSEGWFDIDLRAVWSYRELLFFLVWRELKIRYKQAALGAAWAVIQPILAVLIFTLVFGLFAKIPSDGVPYPVFAFAAMVPWTYFAEAFRRGSVGLVEDSELIRKIYFPRLVLPIAATVAPLVDFLLSFVVLLALMAWYGMMPTLNVVFLPLFLLLAMGLAFASGLWLGPINVRFRDVKHVLPFAIQVWMYASPVVYPISMVPEKWKVAYSLNPMVGVIEGFRWALLGKSAAPDLLAVSISTGIVLIAIAVGLVYFSKAEKTFADVI